MEKNNNTILRFREFPVYKDSRKFRKEVKQLSKDKFPKEELYSLQQQLWRALDSILLNIAEGSDKHSDKDFSHFLNISLGSLNEVVACLDCAFDDNYIEKEEHEKFIVDSEKIIRQLKAFLSKVRKDNKRG
ncbi:hypothetical protein A2442_02590 [Candidatus Campbellbacteria bacterium RIFOXYC2_FULL_35_25]|uniref:Four helix bundle protein n=1 Tax=Candidatus Campbellbacteria bacterium RIFOXYC2_FULL_35_25 TaxID=1797582 RepID=A0A1F5EHX0_9BACT|nr:MAG: hypothetical protein A2442_02590 [Candidatus Campbellbacteria bacterium RIFOXYC2_FULL_35_25]